MNTASLTLYNALKKAGVDDATAQQVSEDVVTQDAAKHFATKADIAEVKTGQANLKASLVTWMFGLHLTTIALVVGLIELLK